MSFRFGWDLNLELCGKRHSSLEYAAPTFNTINPEPAGIVRQKTICFVDNYSYTTNSCMIKQIEFETRAYLDTPIASYTY